MNPLYMSGERCELHLMINGGIVLVGTPCDVI